MQLIPAVTIGSILRPAVSYPQNIETVLCDGANYLCYTYEDAIPKAGHQNWMIPDSFDATISAEPYYAQCVADTQGVIYTSRWNNVESSLGVYDFSKAIAALNYAALQGKQLILRLFFKSYLEADSKPLPTYILNDHATYGGIATSGGLYSNAFTAWSARLDNANVMIRFKALITAYAAAVVGHSAFKGFMFDESTWSVYNAGMPPGLTSSILISTNKDIWAYARAAFAEKEFYPNINYFDDATIATTVEEFNTSVIAGDKIGVTDTFRIPEMGNRKQPVYNVLPQNAFTVVHVDRLSSDGPTGAALTKRMIDNARQACRLGADITAWTTTGGATSEVWAAAKNAMSVIG